jgi:hypothetical protein
LSLPSPRVDEGALREEAREHAGGEAAEVHIVAPARTHLGCNGSPGPWTNRARRWGFRARAAEAVRGRAGRDEIGDPDPLQAIEGRLAIFPCR